MGLDVFIKKVVYGGYGLGEDRGKKFLVRYAAPKELVEVEVLKEKKDYTEATVKSVKIGSAWRRTPTCRYYSHCGGCQLQHIDYEGQLKVKEDILLESLERIGKISLKSVDGVLSSKKELGYRVKVQFKVREGNLGFFSWGTNELVPIEECLLVHPRINQLIPALKETVRTTKDIQEVHVFYSPDEDEFLLKFITVSPMESERLRKLKEHFLPKEVVGVGNYTSLGGKLIKRSVVGREFSFVKVGKYKLRVSNDSFFQVNYTLYEDFPKLVVEEERVKRVLELHSGVGFFSFWMAENCDFLFGSDANGTAIKDAQYNAKLNGVQNVSFAHETALQTIKNQAGEVIDLILLDPPREGLSDGEAKLIIQNKPKRITYISCNPTTLARDLKVFISGGYKLKSIKLVDNFPQTYHVEAIAKLTL
ncbi:class I SAM-dependent RNA methyltransferase [Thermocrinis sp.]